MSFTKFPSLIGIITYDLSDSEDGYHVRRWLANKKYETSTGTTFWISGSVIILRQPQG
jgi:hypothetical protein